MHSSARTLRGRYSPPHIDSASRRPRAQRPSSAGAYAALWRWLRQVARRGPRRGPMCENSQCYLCFHGQRREASLLAGRVLQLSVLLIICRSRVRAPPAPPAVLIPPALDSWLVRGPTRLQLCSCRSSPPAHVEQLPSGSWRAKLYAERDSLAASSGSGRSARRR
jgi:hypothetical protein